MAINDNWYVTAAGAGAKNGNDWANAFDKPAFETHLEGAVVAGDVNWVEDGAYTLDSDIDFTARDGTAVSPIAIIAVKSGTTNEPPLYSDWSIAAGDRPFFDCVTFTFKTGDYTIIRNIDFEGSTNAVVEMGTYCLAENNKFNNDVGFGAQRYGISMSNYARLNNNELTSALGRGARVFLSSKIAYNYFHDMPDDPDGLCLDIAGHGCDAAFNIFDTSYMGIKGESYDAIMLLNNTFYETDTGVGATDGFGWTCINNIMEGNNTAGFVWTTQTDSNFFWNNHGDDVRCNDMWVLVDTTTLFQDYEVVTGDPVFDVPGADFALQNTSPDLNAAMSIGLGVT